MNIEKFIFNAFSIILILLSFLFSYCIFSFDLSIFDKIGITSLSIVCVSFAFLINRIIK